MIDLHTHTLYSDGTDSVKDLLVKADTLGIRCLSITDHNTVDAYFDSAMDHWHDLFSGTLVPGVEITCMYEGEIVEVLGYGFDLAKMKHSLANLVLPGREKQIREKKLIENVFNRVGVHYNPEKISFDPNHESSRKCFWSELIQDPANLRLLTDPESAKKSSIFTRHEIYNPDSTLYVDESSLYPTICAASQAIHSCGGIALLAHLYEYAHADEFRLRLLSILKDNGLDGAECAHSCFRPEQIADMESFCAENALLRSGGSDYHGSRKVNISLGTGSGLLKIPEAYMNNWPASLQIYRK